MISPQFPLELPNHTTTTSWGGWGNDTSSKAIHVFELLFILCHSAALHTFKSLSGLFCIHELRGAYDWLVSLTGMEMSTITPTLRSWPTLLNCLLAIGGYGSFAIRPHDLCAIGQTLVCSTSETSFLLLALNTSDAPCPDACGNQSYSRAIQNSMATSFHALS